MQAVHYLTTTIKDTWRKRKVISALFLDVKGAFPSVNINWLVHDMHIRGIPHQFTDWITQRMSNRRTQLRFDDYTSGIFVVTNGLDQGDPLSPIAYMIYNSDILDVPNTKNGEDAILFVDDTTILVIGRNYTETHKKIEEMLHRQGGILQWADAHYCTFGIEKFQLVDFLRTTNVTTGREGEGEAILIRGHKVLPQESAKLLGISIDRRLNWKMHIAAVLAKGKKWINQFRRLARMNKGISPSFIRQLYLTIAIPRLLYGTDIFLSPQRRHIATSPSPTLTYNVTVMCQLAMIQRRASIMITGTMRTTASSVLNILSGLLPMHLAVDKWRHNAALGLAVTPKGHPLYDMVHRTVWWYVQKHPSPLHELFHTYNIKPDKMEKVVPIRHPSSWNLGIKTTIPNDKNTAIEQCRRDRADYQLYTDGSLTKDGVGAAAVIYKKGKCIALTQLHLGPAAEHTV